VPAKKPGQVQEEEEREAVQEVGREAERERATQEGGPTHRLPFARPGAGCNARRYAAVHV
jgi:hypothetical protein